MSNRLWHVMPWTSKSVLAAGVASLLYLMQPGEDQHLRVVVQVCLFVAGVLGFHEVWASGGRMPQIAGMTQTERLILRTVESASMVVAVLVMLRVF